MDKTFNSLNKAAERLVIKTLLPAIAQFVIVAPATLTVMLLRPSGGSHWMQTRRASKNGRRN